MRPILNTVLTIVTLFSLAACAPAAKALPPAQALSTETTAATTLTVLAAASLTESFSELGGLFESRHPGVRVLFSFAGSQQLVQQLAQGAAADVFASASQKSMDAAVDAKRVRREDVAVFAQNRLAVIYPKNNPGGVTGLADLARPGLTLVLADQSVPAGQYSLVFLDKATADSAFGADYKSRVLANVVSYETNVKSVLTKVSLDEADAGIVYVTDVTPDAAEQVATLTIPDAYNTIASYPIAAIAGSDQADLARAFTELVLSPEGQAVLAKYGFLPGS